MDENPSCNPLAVKSTRNWITTSNSSVHGKLYTITRSAIARAIDAMNTEFLWKLYRRLLNHYAKLIANPQECVTQAIHEDQPVDVLLNVFVRNNPPTLPHDVIMLCLSYWQYLDTWLMLCF